MFTLLQCVFIVKNGQHYDACVISEKSLSRPEFSYTSIPDDEGVTERLLVFESNTSLDKPISALNDCINDDLSSVKSVKSPSYTS